MRDVISQDWEERIVQVDREDLLKKLEANRTKHAADYEESVKGYKEQALKRVTELKNKILKAVDENFEIIVQKIEKFDPEDESPLTNCINLVAHTAFTLEVPQSHIKSYDVAIEMTRWEKRPQVDLPQSQFQCFVLDDWEWRQKFDNISKTYKGR